MKPLIGITTGEIVNKEHAWSPFTYGQSHFYSDAITAAGGLPVLIPFFDDTAIASQLARQCDGFLFSGGNDISPELYGERTTFSKDVSPDRDAWELSLLQAVQESSKPILAICRGMQLLNVSRGGTLYQDIVNQVPASQDHAASDVKKNVKHIAHTITIVPETQLYDMLGASVRTNSHHHQAIKDLGKGLKTAAIAEDGIIEAIEDVTAQFIVAVQSHPESLYATAEPIWRKLFERFITQAAQYKI